MRVVLGASLLVLAAPLTCQTDWTLVQTATAPPFNAAGAPMVYDSARGRVVLFHQGTWEYDGLDWTLATSMGPSPRPGASMAYDSARGRTVLFGGSGPGNTVLAETWEWDGTSWVQIVPVHSPPPGGAFAMDYDAARGLTVLFGGTAIDPASGFYTFFNATWEWDGTDWTLRTPPNSPPLVSSNTPFRFHYLAMAYHPRRQTMIVYGGLEVDRTGWVTARINTTWEWDGTTWTQLHLSAPRSAHTGQAYDAYRGRMVAGVVPYEWDGMGGWVARSTSTTPHATSNGVVFDSRRRVCVYVDPYRQTWEYTTTVPASYRPFGIGCPGGQGAPVLAPSPGSYPWVDSMTSLEVSNLPIPPLAIFMAMGFSDQQFGAITLPANLGPIGLPACTLYIAPRASCLVPIAQGTGLWFLWIPNSPHLAGLSFFNQALVFDPTAPGGATVSNAVEGIAGLR